TPDREKLPKLLELLSEIFDHAGEKRVGSPRRLDSHRPQAFTMETFSPPEESGIMPSTPASLPLALRIFRPPQPFDLRRATLGRMAGPWRSQSHWWGDEAAAQWDGDEWDAEVRLPGFSMTSLCRLLHDRRSSQWYVLGRYD
ncbi:MAG: hypothetical protein ACRD2D_13060, partial [Terriglobales bacterium]